MVKCAKGAGSEIELEIWSMPIEEFGGFMKTIPAPLGIGSVSLSDGSQVNGFICEAAGAEGGEDITHLGDWRHFLQSK
jgi:allophanate hydrolase